MKPGIVNKLVLFAPFTRLYSRFKAITTVRNAAHYVYQQAMEGTIDPNAALQAHDILAKALEEV